MTSDPLGEFCDSGLPEFLQGSWENAKTILTLNGISRHPTDEQKYVVISLFQPIVHTIHVKPTGAIACDKECYRLKIHRICAHTISVAKMLDILDFLFLIITLTLNRLFCLRCLRNQVKSLANKIEKENLNQQGIQNGGMT